MSKVPLTARGAAQLKEELRRLKFEERPKVTAAIATARAHGDLKENAEYHAAKEQQGLMEARIRDIEAKLANAQIIDVTAVNAGGKVVFGVDGASRRHARTAPRRSTRSSARTRPTSRAACCRSARRSRGR